MPNFHDFIERNSTNGKYDWENGLEALLSCITPDPKGIVLKAMGERKERVWYRNVSHIYGEVLNYLRENFGIGFWPLNSYPIWEYLDGKGGGGSLYNVGVVLRQEVEVENWPRIVTRFMYAINDAGIHLARPAVDAAIEFVWRAKEFKEKGELKYSSMQRILSFCQSKTEKRRQITVYDIIKFLLDAKEVRYIDIKNKFKDKYDDIVISYTLNSLGKTGIIYYKSPDRDIQGKRAKKWATYYVKKKINENEIEKLYEEFKEETGHYEKTLFFNVCGHISNKEIDEIVERNEIRRELGYKHPQTISSCLSFLEKKGYLESEFKGGEKLSIAKPNEITKIFYKILLEPIAEIARKLDGSIINYEINSEKVYYFLINYDEERVHRGPRGGEEVTNAILRVLERNGEMKLSYIREEVIKIIGREMSTNNIVGHLRNLIRGGKVEKVNKGIYRIRKKI